MHQSALANGMPTTHPLPGQAGAVTHHAQQPDSDDEFGDFEDAVDSPSMTGHESQQVQGADDFGDFAAAGQGHKAGKTALVLPDRLVQSRKLQYSMALLALHAGDRMVRSKMVMCFQPGCNHRKLSACSSSILSCGRGTCLQMQ